jgi:hypothetical protein
LTGPAGAEIFLVVFHVLRTFLAELTTALLTSTLLATGMLSGLFAAKSALARSAG